MDQNKLQGIINKIVREAIKVKVDGKEIEGEPEDVKQAISGKMNEMARKSEVRYTLKPDFKEDLQDIKDKLSTAEFRSLVDIVKVLKDEGESLTANDILRIHNEKNPDKQYKSQQSFIRPLVIGAIGKKKISYADLPFTASQKDTSTAFEKATGAAVASQGRGSKFGREMEYEPTALADPTFKLPAERAKLASQMLDYKKAREAYRRADSPEEKQKYIDRLQSMVDADDDLGIEVAQQYEDGYITTQDPVTLDTYKKFKSQIKKGKYKIPTFSTQNVDVTQDNPEETEDED